MRDDLDELQIEVEITGRDLTVEDAEKIKEAPQRSPVYNLVMLDHPTVTGNPE